MKSFSRMECMLGYIVKDKHKQNANVNVSFVNKTKYMQHFPINDRGNFDFNEMKLQTDEQFKQKVVSIIFSN